jgi:hypothetical protein
MTPEVKFEERHLQIYGKCPARYRYEVVDGLTGHGDDNAYLKFHTCVRKTIRWIYDEFGNGRTVTVQQAIAQLRIVWADQGPNHAFEPLYLVEATKIVEGVATMPMSGVDSERTWIADLSGKQITMRPDRVLMTPSGSVVAQRIMTGRKTKSESDKPIWELMQLAGQQMFPDRKIELEVFYPAQLEHAAIVSEGNKGLEGYAASIAGIESGMFSPSASRDCPTCQFYFICTSEDFF